ncbi:hypothetical protein SLG_35770 [Sphingobium sp. SYK-6]|uniref:hypothetical protein n=1 Tax=Sphingobium sp. (strain NBRC 103272 / SYK-6) TaxID=627192 RepID=UPI0002277C1B|nr:hypothetical protein [Sphingobium sp. SYK-6]BAK68252.1 hypothetical protein SLG_35770 [Sphingobium sp. SYK-6]
MITAFLMMLATSTSEMPAVPTRLDTVPVIENWQGRSLSPRWSFDAQKVYRRGECHSAVNWRGSQLLEVDVLFLLAGDGTLLKVVPVNSECAEIDSFIGKRVTERLKSSFPASGSTEPQWMKSQVRFLWSD